MLEPPVADVPLPRAGPPLQQAQLQPVEPVQWIHSQHVFPRHPDRQLPLPVFSSAQWHHCMQCLRQGAGQQLLRLGRRLARLAIEFKSPGLFGYDFNPSAYGSTWVQSTSPITLRDIQDGTSNTIAFGEWRTGDFNCGKLSIPQDVINTPVPFPGIGY